MAVVIHRCVLRVSRTNGWSWGGVGAREIIDAATRALPRLLAGRFASLQRPGESIHIRDPLIARATARIGDLAALAQAASGRPGAAAAAGEALAARLADAVEE